MKRFWISCLIVAAVAACGNQTQEPGLGAAAVTAARGNLQGLFKPPPPAPDPRDTLTRAALDALPFPILLGVLEDTDAAFALVSSGRNGTVTQWRTSALEGFNYRSGVLIATQGLGHDLHNADVAPLLAAFARGEGRALTRVHRVLDGESQTQLVSFVCDLTPVGRETLILFDRAYATRHLRETCYGAEARFENEYWLDESGVRQSRQWINAQRGMLLTQNLSP